MQASQAEWLNLWPLALVLVYWLLTSARFLQVPVWHCQHRNAGAAEPLGGGTRPISASSPKLVGRSAWCFCRAGVC